MRVTLLLVPLVFLGCIPAKGTTPDEVDARVFAPPSTDGGRELADAAPPPVDAVAVGDGPVGDALVSDGGPDGDGGVVDDGSVAQDGPVGPPAPECDDGRDNDGDGRFDLEDPDCTSAADPRESGGSDGAACANGDDDDGDGLIDFPNDPGCAGAGDDLEDDTVFEAECHDGQDNDGDGQVDFPDDPGCSGAGDGTERDPPVAPACSNGQDDDQDGETDFPADDGCDSPGDFSEVGPCGEGVEVIDLAPNATHDGDLSGAAANTVGTCGGAAGGEHVFRYRLARRVERLVISTAHPETEWPTVLYVRAACGGAGDLQCDRGPNQEAPGTTLSFHQPAVGTYYIFVDTGSRNGAGRYRLTVEEVEIPQCRDELDNDEDGRVDCADPGCADSEDTDEADPDEVPVCANGEDDDGDGLADYPGDADCECAGGLREAPICPEGPPIIRVGQQGGMFELPAPMGLGGSEPSCQPGRTAEAVLMLDLDLPSDVRVTVNEGGNPAQLALHARTDCYDPESELACRSSQRAGEPLFLEAVPRGRYFVFVEQLFLPAGVMRIATVEVESVITECNDEVHNDGHGMLDSADHRSEQSRDPSEVDPAEPPACSNGQDDDEDMLVDWPEDPGCDAAGDQDEADFRPPAVGLEGRDGVFDGDPWRVCRADEESAWIAANSRGNYNPNAICQLLGYERADMWGGTCGTVCGYCNDVGREHYDNGGGNADRLGVTVHWHCVRVP